MSTNSTLPASVDIAIIGGGMVGLSLALVLAKNSPALNIVVIEALPAPTASDDNLLQPSFDARATALSQSTREIFRQLGLWDELAPGLAPIRHIQVSDRGHPGATRLNADEYDMEALGYVVENRALGQLLYRQVQQHPGIGLVTPATVDRLVPTPRGMDVHVAGHCCAAGLVVVAGGAQSALLDPLGIHTKTVEYGQSALIANIQLSEPHNSIAYERFTERGPVALLPLTPVANQHRAALVWTLPPEQAHELQQTSDDQFLDQLHHWFGYRSGHFLRAGTRHLYPLRLTVAQEQVRRHLVIAGNAAHYLHPVAGQGFNLALRDMARLAEVVAQGLAAGMVPGDLALLQRYEAEQASDQRNTIAFSDSLPALFGRQHPVPVVARNLGLIVTDLVPGLRQQFAHFGSGLTARAAKIGVAAENS